MDKLKHAIKLNRKYLLCGTLIFTFLIFCILPNYVYADLKSMVAGAVAYLVRSIADGIASILKDLDCGLDKLIFNCADGISSATVVDDLNLSLLKGSSTALTAQLYKLYYLFLYIAISILGTIGLLITFDFIKVSSDERHKAVLKQRLWKMILSLVLLTSIPTIFDILVVINQTLTDVFRMMIVDTPSTNFDGSGFLMDIFSQICDKDSSNIIYAAIYLVAGFLNFWLIFYYMIRDLTISFLFLIAPIIAVLLPYRTDLMFKWFKELVSNIFSQSIQACILAVVIAIATSLGDSSSMYDNLFALVAFASFIPLTATIKKALGLEGEIGAAKSMAGLGGVMGAIGLAGLVGSSVAKSAGGIKTGISDLKNIGSEQELLKKSNFESTTDTGKSIPSMSNVGVNNFAAAGVGKGNLNGNIGSGRNQTVDPNNRSSANRNFGVDTYMDGNNIYTASSRARQLQGMKVNARKQVAKSIGSGILGAVGGGLMATGMSAYGSPMMTLMGAKGGSVFGGKMGEVAGSGVTNIASGASEKIQDSMYGEGIRYDNEQRPGLKSVFDGIESFTPSNIGENLDKIKSNFKDNMDVINSNKATLPFAQQQVTGLNSNNLNPEDYKKETAAILKRNSLERRGLFDQANRAYAKGTYDRNNVNPITPEYLKLDKGATPDLLEGRNDSPKLSSPIPPSEQPMSENDRSYINVLRHSMDEHTNDYMDMAGLNENDLKYTDLLQQSMDYNLGQSLSSMFGNDAQYVKALDNSMDYNLGNHILSQVESGQLSNVPIDTSSSIPMNYTADNFTEVPQYFNNPISYGTPNYEQYRHPRIEYNPSSGVTSNINYQYKAKNPNEAIKNTLSSRENHVLQFMNNEEYLQALQATKSTIEPLHISGVNSQLA